MISSDINQDKLLSDIEQQIEVLSAIAADNAILNEQLRLLHESREHILWLNLEVERLADQLDPDSDQQGFTVIDLRSEGQD